MNAFPAVTLREASVDDAEQIAALTRQLGYEASAANIRERLSRLLRCDEQSVCVAECAGQVAGWTQGQAAEALESGYRVEIVGLVVGAQFRRRGVGRMLVQAIERWARLRGAGVVVVRSNTARVESHQFYPALGYETVKTQAVYRKHIAPGV